MAIPITKHFSTDEFFHSDLAVQNNIMNIPDDACSEVYSNIIYISYMLELIRKQFNHPIRITSGYRCPALNKLVGGSAKSKHLSGLAVDINCGKKLNERLYYIIDNLINVLPVEELINEQDYTWIHVSFKKL